MLNPITSTTTSSPSNSDLECLDLYQSGQTQNGVYDIRTVGQTVSVYCQMTDQGYGTGWTVFQKRAKLSLGSYLSFDERGKNTKMVLVILIKNIGLEMISFIHSRRQETQSKFCCVLHGMEVTLMQNSKALRLEMKVNNTAWHLVALHLVAHKTNGKIIEMHCFRHQIRTMVIAVQTQKHQAGGLHIVVILS